LSPTRQIKIISTYFSCSSFVHPTAETSYVHKYY
jgi:hypothetical protein